MGGRFGELLLLFILALLFFGPNKLPDMAKSLGQALNEFKKAANPDGDNSNSSSQPSAAQATKTRRKRVKSAK